METEPEPGPPALPVLFSDDALAASDVAVNSAMNRGRGLSGTNSYARELRFEPLPFLVARGARGDAVRWLDLACGEGRALREAAALARNRFPDLRFEFLGVDLLPPRSLPDAAPTLKFVAASALEWTPEGRFDLITCVHGLHYVGDKLGLLARIASWLAPDGLFLGHLDPKNLRLEGAADGRRIMRALSAAGFERNRTTRLLIRRGHAAVTFPFRFLGGDPHAGPNFTLQPAVDSVYAPLRSQPPSPVRAS